jgi:nickel/cobalt transporter (NicO) family protein
MIAIETARFSPLDEVLFPRSRQAQMPVSPIFDAAAADAWVFIPTAILLGALHGLEPGHSKTMMAAFIVAVRGTVAQAALLGLSATISHTAIVWLVALTGMYFGAKMNLDANEPYLQLISGALILSVGAWMFWRIWRNSTHGQGVGERSESAGPHSDHAIHRIHDHHSHGAHDHDHHHGPHTHAPHTHGAGAALADSAEEQAFENDLSGIDHTIYADAHEREHALEIERRFAHRTATTGQIVVFGLTGGLIPCPASITVLLLCLQAGRFALGAALVLSFSIGLALTLVFVGVAAALGVRHAVSRWPVLESLASRAPYFSSALVALVGLYTIGLGATGLA